MKTFTGLYPQICSFENLWKAADQSQKGKRFQYSVSKFNFHREREIFQLQEELIDKVYQPGEYHEFTIYEPKKRLISAANRNNNNPTNTNNNNGFRCSSQYFSCSMPESVSQKVLQRARREVQMTFLCWAIKSSQR
ncbi:hypothetical protein GF312_06500 [Candidatus Poribacteria bacterium]|nr:hypothetical protein [Candidatus Poribacteria bacterium]